MGMMGGKEHSHLAVSLLALALAVATGLLPAAAQSGSEAVVCVGSETRTLSTNPIRRGALGRELSVEVMRPNGRSASLLALPGGGDTKRFIRHRPSAIRRHQPLCRRPVRLGIGLWRTAGVWIGAESEGFGPARSIEGC